MQSPFQCHRPDFAACIQDPIPYLPDYHASDTFDRVNQREERITLAISSVLLWAFADSPERLPRQTRAEVEKLLHDTKLDDQMKAFGQWDDFQAGRRGLATLWEDW